MMIRNHALSQPFVPVIQLTNIRLILFSVVFVAFSVLTPYLTHQFNLAGPTFLPIHFFVLLAGLLFGWRLGLIVGLFSPWVSFLTSGMPPFAILPQLTLEIGAYGLVVGILRQNLKLNPWFSLVGAMIIGRIFLLIGMVIFTTAPSVFSALWGTISTGLPGLVIQLILLPIFTIYIASFLKKDHEKNLPQV